MFKQLFLLTLIGLFLIGCSTLSESQLKAVNDYSEATEKYADFPAAIVAGYIDVQNDVFVLQSALKASPAEAASYLAKNIEKKNETKSNAEELDVSFKLIKAYAKNLSVLASTDYSEKLTENADLLGSSVDSLIVQYNSFSENEISDGIGKLVKKAINFLGEKRINKERTEALKEYIGEGEKLIQKVCETSLTFFKQTVKMTWIDLLSDDIEGIHEDLRAQISDNNTKDIMAFIEVDHRVAALYDEVYHLEKLNNALIKSIDNLSKAHSKLNKVIQEKVELEEVISELATFISNVAELTELHEKLRVETETNAE